MTIQRPSDTDVAVAAGGTHRPVATTGMPFLVVLAVMCVAAWIGVMGFFSFAAAPLLFTTFEPALAGRVVVAALPRYYAIGIVLSTLALLLLLLAAARSARGRWAHLGSSVLAAAMVLMLGLALGDILPRANVARATGDTVAFASAHGTAIQLNVWTFVAGVGLLVVASVSAVRRRR